MKFNALMGRGSLLVAACLLLLSTGISSASAEYIQFTFTGEVTEITGVPWDPWHETQLGDPVTVQYTVDSNAEDQSQGSNVGHYVIFDATLTLGNVSNGAPTANIELLYDYHPNFLDHYLLYFDFGNEIQGSSYIRGIDLFSSDALPTDVDWTQYASGAGGTVRFGPTNDNLIRYNLTTFEAVGVPGVPTLFVFVLSALKCRRK